jgi:hypothetical protein
VTRIPSTINHVPGAERDPSSLPEHHPQLKDKVVLYDQGGDTNLQELRITTGSPHNGVGLPFVDGRVEDLWMKQGKNYKRSMEVFCFGRF